MIDSLSIKKPGIEEPIIQGSIYKLKSWELIKSTLSSIAVGGPNSGIHEDITISDFGQSI